MKKAEEKQKYEPALLELVKFGAFDVITTSVFEENVDPDGWTQARCVNEIRSADDICRTNEMCKKRISEFTFYPKWYFENMKYSFQALRSKVFHQIAKLKNNILKGKNNEKHKIIPNSYLGTQSCGFDCRTLLCSIG